MGKVVALVGGVAVCCGVAELASVAAWSVSWPEMQRGCGHEPCDPSGGDRNAWVNLAGGRGRVDVCNR